MLRRILLSVAVALSMTFLMAGALAADPLEKTTGNGVRYISGGIGKDEADALRAMTGRYSLDLMMATPSGSFLSNVQVTIRQGTREVLSTVTDGPILLVDLPPGRYAVEAVAEGIKRDENVTLLQGEHRRLVLRWPIKTD